MGVGTFGVEFGQHGRYSAYPHLLGGGGGGGSCSGQWRVRGCTAGDAPIVNSWPILSHKCVATVASSAATSPHEDFAFPIFLL